MSEFYTLLKQTLNSGKSRSVILWGNIYDLFPHKEEYVSLVDFILCRTKAKGIMQLVYELNGPVRMSSVTRARIKQIWNASYLAKDSRENFEQKLLNAVGRPAVAFELLRQITMACRDKAESHEILLIIIEAADMMIPSGSNFSNLNAVDRRCVCIAKDWFSDPNFVMGRDSVILLAESVSELHPNVARLPQMSQIEVPSPTFFDRVRYIDANKNKNCQIVSVSNSFTALVFDGRRYSKEAGILACKTAGLTLQAVRQILCDNLDDAKIFSQVEHFIKSQVGEDIIEFKKPSHTLDNVIGNTQLKKFIRDELIPRFRSTGQDALSGAAVGGPIGSGKTFIFEAVAGEIGCPVIILKNLRSQYFGQTDVIFERLRRVLESIGKVLIFVDEADTQFGRVSGDVHATEKRLTGKIQAMMSDPKLKGQVCWLLMTARIHLLSPDIRRPGRAGDLIIPVLDPDKDDRLEFAKWCVLAIVPSVNETYKLDEWAKKIIGWLETRDYSAAAWAGLRSNIIAKKAKNIEDIKEIVWELIQPDIAEEREYQKFQALLNCTRKSLLPKSFKKNGDFNMKDLKNDWKEKIHNLEQKRFG